MTIANKQQEVSLLITGLGKQRIILGLPWLIKENPDIDWTSGTLQFPFTIIEDNDDYKGGDFINVATIFLEYFENNEQSDDDSLKILKAKISKQFDQLYGNHKKKDLTPEQLIPKHFHKYIKLVSKTASERYPGLRSYNHKIYL